jgi:hypothetical protein
MIQSVVANNPTNAAMMAIVPIMTKCRSSAPSDFARCVRQRIGNVNNARLAAQVIGVEDLRHARSAFAGRDCTGRIVEFDARLQLRHELLRFGLLLREKDRAFDDGDSCVRSPR